MRKLLIIAMISTLFSSCALRDMYIDDVLMEKYTGFELYYQDDFTDVQYIEQIPWFMYRRVEYTFTKEVQSPEKTLKRGKGDCDGFCMLYMDIAFFSLGIKCDLAFTHEDARKIIDGGKVSHALLRLPDGSFIEGQNGEPYHGKIGYIIKFDDVFSK